LSTSTYRLHIRLITYADTQTPKYTHTEANDISVGIRTHEQCYVTHYELYVNVVCRYLGTVDKRYVKFQLNYL